MIFYLSVVFFQFHVLWNMNIHCLRGGWRTLGEGLTGSFVLCFLPVLIILLMLECISLATVCSLKNKIDKN